MLRPVSPGRMRKPITELGSDAYAERERATFSLEMMQELAVPALHEALDRKPEPEIGSSQRLIKRGTKGNLESGSNGELDSRAGSSRTNSHTQGAVDIVRALANGDEETGLKAKLVPS